LLPLDRCRQSLGKAAHSIAKRLKWGPCVTLRRPLFEVASDAPGMSAFAGDEAGFRWYRQQPCV